MSLSALLPSVADRTWVECGRFEACLQKVCPPGAPGTPEILAEIDQLFGEFAPVLNIAAPRKSMVDAYNEVAAAAG